MDTRTHLMSKRPWTCRYVRYVSFFFFFSFFFLATCKSSAFLPYESVPLLPTLVNRFPFYFLLLVPRLQWYVSMCLFDGVLFIEKGFTSPLFKKKEVGLKRNS